MRPEATEDNAARLGGIHGVDRERGISSVVPDWVPGQRDVGHAAVRVTVCECLSWARSVISQHKSILKYRQTMTVCSSAHLRVYVQVIVTYPVTGTGGSGAGKISKTRALIATQCIGTRGSRTIVTVIDTVTAFINVGASANTGTIRLVNLLYSHSLRTAYSMIVSER